MGQLVLAGVAGLVVPIAIASAVHDMNWQAFMPAAAATSAAGAGLAIQQFGVKARTRTRPGIGISPGCGAAH